MVWRKVARLDTKHPEDGSANRLVRGYCMNQSSRSTIAQPPVILSKAERRRNEGAPKDPENLSATRAASGSSLEHSYAATTDFLREGIDPGEAEVLVFERSAFKRNTPMPELVIRVGNHSRCGTKDRKDKE